jgi:hypothetical protein
MNKYYVKSGVMYLSLSKSGENYTMWESDTDDATWFSKENAIVMATLLKTRFPKESIRVVGLEISEIDIDEPEEKRPTRLR